MPGSPTTFLPVRVLAEQYVGHQIYIRALSSSPKSKNMQPDLSPIPLPRGITSRMVQTAPHGLNFHILEAGSDGSGRPLILLIHGFPELAYSWRHTILPLASAGYHVVAFDQRGYGRTHSTNGPIPLSDFRPLKLVKDVVVLAHALGHTKVKCIVGHDFGAVTAALCALARPDYFENVVLMSHPFRGPPALPQKSADELSQASQVTDMEAELAKLERPRKHYKWYYCTPNADREMMEPKEGLPEFLRGYFYLKSADWDGNDAHPLDGWKATELAKMPRYYIMDKEDTMREAIARDMADEDPHVVRQGSRRWLSDQELAVYVDEYSRNSFQGGLNWYRVQTQPDVVRELEIFAGKKIEIPCLFVSGKKDWGPFQEPGALEDMGKVCVDFRGERYVEGAGHWLPQERPQEAVKEILGLIEAIQTRPDIMGMRI
jgi:pimeloyl-ACP methyl ester carboxylesterase